MAAKVVQLTTAFKSHRSRRSTTATKKASARTLSPRITARLRRVEDRKIITPAQPNTAKGNQTETEEVSGRMPLTRQTSPRNRSCAPTPSVEFLCWPARKRTISLSPFVTNSDRTTARLSKPKSLDSRPRANTRQTPRRSRPRFLLVNVTPRMPVYSRLFLGKRASQRTIKSITLRSPTKRTRMD